MAVPFSSGVWLVAAALYVGFRLFYDNWRGKLSQGEIDTMLARIEAQGEGDLNDMGIVRTFLENDDGREFLMVNLVKVPETTVTDPDTGAQVPAADMMKKYSSAFIKRLLRYGGHPAIAARKVGGYVDAWMVGPDPGWTIAGVMRYRSRRDLLKIAADPNFHRVHKYKVLGVAETFSFPTQAFLRAYVSPRVTVFLVLALAAALAQVAILATR